MKKILLLTIILFKSVSVFASEEKPITDAFLFQPLPFIIAPALGGVEFVIEGQSAITKSFALSCTVDSGSIGGVTTLATWIGPQIHPGGRYLEGFYFGVRPGYMTVFGYDIYGYREAFFFFSTMVEAGYEWVWDSGFALNLAGGFTSVMGHGVSQVVPNLTFGIGYGFTPKYRNL